MKKSDNFIVKIIKEEKIFLIYVLESLESNIYNATIKTKNDKIYINNKSIPNIRESMIDKDNYKGIVVSDKEIKKLGIKTEKDLLDRQSEINCLVFTK